MSIVIQNMGWTNTHPPAAHDECLYAVRINHTTLAGFKHSRKAGLAACLRAAADAIEKGEFNDDNPAPLRLMSENEKYIHSHKEKLNDEVSG